MQITDHFSLAELTTTSTGLPNNPGPGELLNLRRTAQMMEQVRAVLGYPITISSGYRSPAVNKAVGGVATSDHVKGYAVDFTCPGYGSPTKIADAIAKSGIPFHQVIDEAGRWVHLSSNPKQSREYLVATFRNGKASYRRK